MDRRKFINSAGLAGILAAGVAPAARANQAIRWRLASSFPKSQDIGHGALQLFARTVKEMSGGKIEISIHLPDELMPAFGVLEGVQRGSVECGHTASYYYTDKDETFALDGTIPFGMNSRQMTAWMRHGNGQALLREFFRGFGIVNFPLGNSGAQMAGWYRKPVRSLADIKGLKMRIGGLGGQVFTRIGGVAVNLPGADIYRALEQGRIHAAEWVGPYDDLKLGLHKLTKYYGYPGWWEGGAQSSLYINQRAFDALTTESRAIIEAAAALAHLDTQAQYDAKNPVALKELVALGARLMPMPKAVLDAAYKAAQGLYAELAGKNPQWKKIYGSYAAFLKDQSWGWGYTEMAFDSYMHQKGLIQQKAREVPPGKSRR
jgi:TRAP-type mannitol/chloroaromatic compound transport system substrate-binding protein